MIQKLTAQTIKRKSNEYFRTCETENQFPTVSGLAFSVGFNSKEQILRFQGDENCKKEIQRALLFLEKKLELSLFNKDLFQAAKFVLTTQFTGWNDKEEQAQVPVYIVDDVKSLGTLSPKPQPTFEKVGQNFY